MGSPKRSDDLQATSLMALCLRLFWMAIGGMGLGLSGASIVAGSSPTYSTADVVYGLLVVLMIVARYVDITRFAGTTASGKPANLAHWRRFALVLLAASVGAWLVLHGIRLRLST